MPAGMGALGLVIVSAVGLHLEHSDVPVADTVRLLDQLKVAVESRTNSTVIVDSPDWTSECDAALVCLKEISARTSADEIVLLRLFDGVKAVRVVARRAVVGLGVQKDASADLPRAKLSELGPSDLDPLVAQLFEAPKSELIAVGATKDSSSSTRASTPWVLAAMGAGVALAIAGVVFKIQSGNTARDLASPGSLSASEIEGLESTQATQEDLYRGLAIGSVVSLTAGALLLLLD